MLPGWSRGAHAPSRAAVDASSTAPTRAFARGSRMAGNPQFWISPANPRRAGFPTCVPWPSRNGFERGCAPQATGILLFSDHIPLKKHIMQVPVLTLCYTAANVSNPAGRVATDFPLPSTGRGIEGEGWVISRAPSRASLRWWTKSRCDFVCLRSRHFVAWLRRGLAHDAMAIQTTHLSQGFTQLHA